MTEAPWENVDQTIAETGAPEFNIGDKAKLMPECCMVTISGRNNATRSIERRGQHRIWTAFRVPLDQLEAVKE